MTKELVVSCIFIKNTSVLFEVRKSLEGGLEVNKFLFPGGKLEEWETLFEALKREIFEELGLILQIEDVTQFSFLEYKKEDRNKVVFFYLFDNFDGKILNKENRILEWRDFSELKNIEMLPHNKIILEKLVSFIENKK